VNDLADGQLSPRIVEALDELAQRLLERYPTATFWWAWSIDSPDGIWLSAYVDDDDSDRVIDLVIDRLVDLLIDDGLSISIHPMLRPLLAAQYGPRTDAEYAAMDIVSRMHPLHVRVPTGN
jgi:hypothetical protein